MEKQKYKTAIIGPSNVISGFKALGVIPFDAEEGGTALDILKKIKKDTQVETGARFAVVIIIESVANKIPKDEFEKVSRGVLPAILTLPGLEG